MLSKSEVDMPGAISVLGAQPGMDLVEISSDSEAATFPPQMRR